MQFETSHRFLDGNGHVGRLVITLLCDADVLRELDDFEDVAAAIQALQDPADPVLDWDSVRRDLLGQD